MTTDMIIERVTGYVVFSCRTAAHVKMTVVANGEWSGRDMENLYELLGHQLRDGAFDPTSYPHGTAK